MRRTRLTFQPIIAAGLEPTMIIVLLALRNPENHDLSAALSVVRRADGLIIDQSSAEKAIFNGLIWAVFSAEAAKRKSRGFRSAREFNAKRQVTIEKLRRLHTELDMDARIMAELELPHTRSSTPFPEPTPLFVETMNDLSKAIESLTRWTTEQTLILHNPGGNRRPFERAFVRAMREVWFTITGKEAGVARKCVVEFSAAVWTALTFPNPSVRPVEDWLYDRFSKVR